MNKPDQDLKTRMSCSNSRAANVPSSEVNVPIANFLEARIAILRLANGTPREDYNITHAKSKPISFHGLGISQQATQ